MPPNDCDCLVQNVEALRLLVEHGELAPHLSHTKTVLASFGIHRHLSSGWNPLSEDTRRHHGSSQACLPHVLYLSFEQPKHSRRAVKTPSGRDPRYRPIVERMGARHGRKRGSKIAAIDIGRRLTEAIWYTLTRDSPFAPAGAPNA
jgi:hypothetical protein